MDNDNRLVLILVVTTLIALIVGSYFAFAEKHELQDTQAIDASPI